MAESIGSVQVDVEVNGTKATKGFADMEKGVDKFKGKFRDTVQLADALAGGLDGAAGQAAKLGGEMMGAFGSGGIVSIGVAAIAGSIALWVKYFNEAEAAQKSIKDAMKANIDNLDAFSTSINKAIEGLSDSLLTADELARRANKAIADQAQGLVDARLDSIKNLKAELATLDTRPASSFSGTSGEYDKFLADRRNVEARLQIEESKLASEKEMANKAFVVSTDATNKKIIENDFEALKKKRENNKKHNDDVTRENEKVQRERDQFIKEMAQKEADRWRDLGDDIINSIQDAVKEIERLKKETIEVGESFKGPASSGLSAFAEALNVSSEQLSLFKGTLLQTGQEGAIALGALSAGADIVNESLGKGLAALSDSVIQFEMDSEQAQDNATYSLENRILSMRLAERARKESAKAGKTITEDELTQLQKLEEANGAVADAAEIANKNEAAETAKRTKEVIASIAQEAIVRGVMETAAGFAAAATGNVPGSIAHFTAAGIYGTVGGIAAAAASSIAIPDSGEDELTKQQLEAERADMLAEQRKERAGDIDSRNATTRERQQIINITVLGNPLLTQADIGQHITEAIKAYDEQRG